MALPGVEAHLAAPQRGQVVLGGAPLEIHFVILGSEVRAAPPLQEALCLPRLEGGVLGTPGRGSDVDDVARALAPVLGLDRMNDVVVPPHRVTRLDPWDGDESLRRDGVPACIEGQGVAGLGTAEL